MKTRFLLLLFVCLAALPGIGQGTATTSGQCVSMMFAVAETQSLAVIWTTYSARRGLPLGKRTSAGRIHSLEFRPRSGQPGVYEADYIVAAPGLVLEFGSITLNLPVDDLDANGVPDLLEFSRGVDAVISGSVQPDYVGSGRRTLENFTGTLRREAGQFEGHYSFSLFRNGETVSERFRILSYDGEVTYQRGTRNLMTSTATPHREGATPQSVTVTYRVLGPDKVLIPAQRVLANGESQRRHRVILNRVGNRYVFTPNNRDGNPETPWKDYVRWIEQIVDTTDSDGDGIPDFSDPDAVP